MRRKFQYEVRVSVPAQKQFKMYSKAHKRAILEVLKELRDGPFFGKSLSRELSGRYTLRVEAYRIIYKVNLKDRVVKVLAFDHRGRVYN